MEQLNVGIGFATGRTSFQNVLRAYMYQLDEYRFFWESEHVNLNLFVAYDLDYSNTKPEDYTQLPAGVQNWFEKCFFLGKQDIRAAERELVEEGIVKGEEAGLCFGNGYAAQRNIVVYTALRSGMDYLIFLDDDEYPMAATQSGDYVLWSGQHVIEDHIRYLKFSDITNGFHCGYLSPIPYMEFDNIVSEDVFRAFIEALSNDILNWEDVKAVIENGGVTFADKKVLMERAASLVEEINGTKFITGGNLGLNLTRPEIVFPFYNPPGARGEDTFLSTCLHDVTVKKVPSYTFHDGFAFYRTLLQGVLPNNLKRIQVYDSQSVIERFYRACIGWARYKPLYTYITRKEDYEALMRESRAKLEQTVPQICAYFNEQRFADVLDELHRYEEQLPVHFEEFQRVKDVWERMKQFAAGKGRTDG
ncbi:hypothetical protein [Anaerolentibacter hominis]|uniref:hypothetical protein n=1 Tax=Anaerolentibacter hominis TaxID=3079009 RepID=UPI0031B87266